MSLKPDGLKFLFIINPGSGNGDTDYKAAIQQYFSESSHDFEIYDLPSNCSLDQIKAEIKEVKPDRVVAVGGDGTIKLVAQCLLKSDTPIGIIAAGSANGMAKELGISLDVNEALDTVVMGHAKKIHAVVVNDELCIHLSDIGFNAYIIKKFDDLPQRGMRGYAKAAWHALWNHHKMQVNIKIDGEEIRSEAAMVVIANATMYGTGVKINPDGKLDDEVFEVILVKNYSLLEILKIRFTNLPFNPNSIETFKTDKLVIKSKHRAHFQVDGEYQGKVNTISAHIITDAIAVIVAPEQTS
jgi:diacylglycerol kinase (ATP)